MSRSGKHRLLIAVSAVAVVLVFLLPPISQDPLYHQFADHHRIFSIPNGLNVLSNLLFLWVGVEGTLRLVSRRGLQIVDELYPAYLAFFVALGLIAVGSSYYHLAPDNPSLAVDRGAMTIAFMSFFTIILGERVSTRVAKRLFPALVLAGIGSIVYWHFSEFAGHGDLRPYALVQFLPMLLIPMILLAYPSRFGRTTDLWWLLVWYLIAKFLEVLDHQIYDILSVAGGHSLKHVAAGISCYIFLRHLRLRRRVGSD